LIYINVGQQAFAKIGAAAENRRQGFRLKQASQLRRRAAPAASFVWTVSLS
jgi:hypothetical protein